MSSFRRFCINYLLSRGWEQNVDGWEWYHFTPYDQGPAFETKCETLGAAIDTQMEWDDEGPN